MKLREIVLIALLLGVLMLGGACASDSAKLAEGFDADRVEESAVKVIDLLNRQDSAALVDMSDDTMKEVMPEAKYQEVYGMMKEWGAFKANEKTEVMGQQSNGVDYAVAIVKSKYEKKDAVWTISFDKEMRLAGLFVK